MLATTIKVNTKPRWTSKVLWNVPLGWQLSALYTLLLAITLAVIGFVVYSQQQSFLVQDTAHRLEQSANAILSRSSQIPANQAPQFDQFNHPDSVTAQNGFGGRDDDNHMVENLIRGLSGPDVNVAILSSDGSVITQTQGLDGDTSPKIDAVTSAQASAALQSATPVQWVSTGADGSRQVVVLMSMVINSADAPTAASTAQGTTLLLEQSASLAAAEASLNQLGTFLLLGVLFGTLAGVVLGVAFTRAVLRPLDQVAITAEAIAAGDLQRRLELPDGKNELARVGKAFDHMVGRLVSTLEAQRRFVADASHEMRTPLTSLKGMTEILMIGAHGNDGRVIEQSAQAIHGELDRLGRLVNDLLLLSRLDSSTEPPSRRSRSDVSFTLKAAVQQMELMAEDRGISLRLESSEQLPTIADSGQIKQVILNLIDNALHYTALGGKIVVRGKTNDASARIEVEDTGAGIDPRDLPHIFERFYRGDTSRARATGSSGLGLAIARAIIEAHGGTIDAVSEVGKGACFTVTLPLAHASAAVEKASALTNLIEHKKPHAL